MPFMTFSKFLYRLTHWETWDYRVKLVPLAPFWVWHCLRSGSWWFFTPSNPTLTFGGFEGESKQEMYEQLPPGSYPRSLYVSPDLAFAEADQLVVAHRYDYPFVVKPDVGMMGLMFRKISSVEEFRRYHQKMPVRYIVQELIRYPIEVSVFYYRFPHEAKGTITGFLRKEFLEVVGDGQSTLWELIGRYPRVAFRLEEMKAKHADKLQHIVPEGEIYCLNYALNLTRGGKLVSLAHEKDEQLLAVFDGLSHYTKHFYFGRYDIKCASIEDLKAGKNYSILEFNGSGAAPHHVYGNGNSLWQAYKIVLHHWEILYQISKQNAWNGVPYWKFRPGWTFLQGAKKHLKMLKRLERESGG